MLHPPRTCLNFKRQRVGDEVFVFVQVIDFETGNMREQRETLSAAAADHTQAISDAWSKLETRMDAPSESPASDEAVKESRRSCDA